MLVDLRLRLQPDELVGLAAGGTHLVGRQSA
jgi:hypothetical protein